MTLYLDEKKHPSTQLALCSVILFLQLACTPLPYEQSGQAQNLEIKGNSQSSHSAGGQQNSDANTNKLTPRTLDSIRKLSDSIINLGTSVIDGVAEGIRSLNRQLPGGERHSPGQAQIPANQQP